jgi:uncharacterized protein
VSAISTADPLLPPLFLDAMTRGSFYPHPCGEVEVVQTMTAWVLLAGDFVYKIKKPVQFDFVDSSTRAKRYRLCLDEVRLNRRLAPQVYQRVSGISEHAAGYKLVEKGTLRDGMIDFAVVMRRLPRDRMLDQMIANGMAEAGHLRAVAETIVAFRDRVRANKSRVWGSAQAIAQLAMGNISEAESGAADSISREQLGLVKDYSRRYVAANRDLLDKRARDGHVREGHGNLRCDSICFTAEGPVILDCVEYSQQLRYADAASEIAALTIDLELRGRPDLSAQFVRAYVAASNDQELPLLLPLYQCYRAVQRSRLETLASFRPELPIGQRVLARGAAGQYLRLAALHAGAGAPVLSL